MWSKFLKERYLSWVGTISHLHDDVILLLRLESFRVFPSCANKGFRYLNLTGIAKFKYERKNEKDSGGSSKIRPSCKWLIVRACKKGVSEWWKSQSIGRLSNEDILVRLLSLNTD